MDITSIQVVGKTDGIRHIYRLHSGADRLRKCLVIQGSLSELELIAKSLLFAFSSQKDPTLDEVQVEISDNAGATWTIHRGAFGSRFLKDGRSIAIDEAQRSMLASWFEMEVALSSIEGLISPVADRRIITKKGKFAVCDGRTSGDVELTNQANSELVIKILSEECAKVVGIPEFSDVRKISSIADTLISLRGRYIEAQQLPDVKSGDHAPSLSMIETLQRELDHLLQIEFYCRRVSDSCDSISGLTSQIETVEGRIAELRKKWLPEAFAVGRNFTEWSQGLDLLVKSKGYERLADTAGRIKRLIHERVRPLAQKALGAWDDFLLGSKESGQDVESCLASTLLGLKQLGQDLERFKTALPEETITVGDSANSWFHRIRGLKPPVQSTFEVPVGLGHQREWVSRSQRELETVKESVSFALKTAQEFVDQLTQSREVSSQELQKVEEVAFKSETELERLRIQWGQWSQNARIPFETQIESMCELVIESCEIDLLALRKEELTQRLNERVHFQATLETLVRQWWELIGSDRKADLSNSTFLVAEAKAALRYRDSRRQRVQKIIKDSARGARDESIRQWSHKRKAEILVLWQTAFEQVGLPVLDIADQSVGTVVQIGSAIQAMNQLQAIKEEALFLGTGRVFETNHAPISLYRFYDLIPSENDREAFVNLLKTEFEGASESISLLLVQNTNLMESLSKSGCGYAVRVSSHETTKSSVATSPSGFQGSPERAAGIIKAGAKDARAPKDQSQVDMPRQKGHLSQRAADALRILNPKSSGSTPRK